LFEKKAWIVFVITGKSRDISKVVDEVD
jgi:hypothetical protein